MCSGRDTRALPRVGSPIRRSAGRRLFSTSPRLIAAVHVLPRLLAPRHPPRALHILTEHTFATMQFSRYVAGVERPARGPRSTEATLKTKQHAGAPVIHEFTNPVGISLWCSWRVASRPGVDVRSRASARPVSDRGSSNEPCGSEPRRPLAGRIPRKEVIQPQLPLRLPCYDFTPIADPTFDGCLPCGLAHRLRVLPTFVV
jgi:hypothetical protein